MSWIGCGWVHFQKMLHFGVNYSFKAKAVQTKYWNSFAFYNRTLDWNCHADINLFKLENWQNRKPNRSSGPISFEPHCTCFCTVRFGLFEIWDMDEPSHAAGGLWCLAYFVPLWTGLFCLRSSLHCVSFSQAELWSAVRPCRNSVCSSKRAALKMCEWFQTLIQPSLPHPGFTAATLH